MNEYNENEYNTQFIDLLKTVGRDIELASREFLEEFSNDAVKNSFVQDSLKSLCEQNEGGKRIRAAMIKVGEMIASHGKSDHYLPVAIGYELFQTAILIHDDVIDKSDTRRGKPTIHAETALSVSSTLSKDTAQHFGLSRALCIGDYAFFIAYHFLSKCRVADRTLLKLYDLFSNILANTCEGEIMDVISPFEKISILESYEEYTRLVTQIYEYKTARYTLAGPMILGAVCGGANTELTNLLEKITIPLGIAYQIKDDLLGIYSSDEALGKSVLSDIRENKQTLLYGFAYKNSNEQQRDILDRLYGNKDADIDDLEMVREIFTKTGAKKYSEEEIIRLSNVSRSFIPNAFIDEEYQSVLRGLIHYLIDRDF